MSRDLHPTEGARFLLERVDGSDPAGARATYRAAVYTPDAVFSSTATLGEDGTAEVPPTGAPAELDDMLVMLARLTARGAAKRRADELVVWPARLLRWRGPGRGPVR